MRELIVPIALIVFVVVFMKRVGYEFDRRCPNCRKWFAGRRVRIEKRVIKKEQLIVTENERLMVNGIMKDIIMEKPMTSVSTIQLRHFQCKFCNHQWESKISGKDKTEVFTEEFKRKNPGVGE